MIDEDAFGLLIGYLSLEEDEYRGEREEFVSRYEEFRSLLEARVAEGALGPDVRALELGHAFYVEVLDVEGRADPLAWLRATRERLGERGFETSGVLTFGATWLVPRAGSVTDGSGATPPSIPAVVRASGPSEPLRHALLAEAATRGRDEDGSDAWGAGLYVSLDAVEALGRKPKNEPTVLRCSGCGFLRAGK